MNRLTNEQCLQIIEFSFKKVYCPLLPFYVTLIDPLKRLLWLNFAPNLHCWILNQQHSYVECELKKISQLYRSVVLMTINYQFVAVRSNWASVTQQREKFCERILQLVQELKPNDLPQRIIFGLLKSWSMIFSSKNCLQRRSSFLSSLVCK